MFFIIPMMVGLMCLSDVVISIIYQRGEFGIFAAEITSKALFFFTPGMIGFGLQAILSRAFYAEQNGKIPLISGVFSIASNILLCMLLIPSMDVGGLALASALSQSVSAIILIIPMQKKNSIFDRNFVKEFFKMAVCSAVMAFAVMAAKTAVKGFVPAGLLGGIIVACVCVCAGCAVYIAGAYILKINEAVLIFDIVSKIFGKERKAQ